ncbi:MAG: hypothetical protein VZR36_11690 [Prevotella sp.]|nr:hypothetical protein [Prevotella sp.]
MTWQRYNKNLRKSPLLNRDGNANVRFMQAEAHRRFFEMMRSFGIHIRQNRRNQE